jgi:hypothetical protein
MENKAKNSALDPVCLSSPMLSWVPNYNALGIVDSVGILPDNVYELVLNITMTVQCRTLNFFQGCVLSSTTPLINMRCISSVCIDPSHVRINVISSADIPVGIAVSLKDYTTFNPPNVRAPTDHNMGMFSILYNETLDQFTEILSLDDKTRRLVLNETSLPGWSINDNINIRDATPIYWSTITSSTINSITASTNIPESVIGDWIRIRLQDYSVEPIENSTKRQIVNVQGNIVFVFPRFPTPPLAGTKFEIMQFSYDNAHPIQSIESAFTRPFSISLVSISIPYCKIRDGDLDTLRILYLEFNDENESISQKNLINSNNPHVPEAGWRCLKDSSHNTGDFIKFIPADIRLEPQRVYVNIQEPVKMTIRLENGVLFKPLEDDTKSPDQAWYDLNVIIEFDIKIAD